MKHKAVLGLIILLIFNTACSQAAQNGTATPPAPTATTTPPPTTAPETSADAPLADTLTEEISRLIGGLGLFAAIMAVLAVGTEVVVDTMRLPLGLKRKPTSLEALDQLSDMLPGRLESLGVAATAQTEVKTLVARLRTTLQPVQDAQSALANARSGAIGAAVADLIRLANSQSDRPFKELQGEVTARLSAALREMGDRLSLSDEIVAGLTAGTKDIVGKVSQEDAATVITTVLGGVLQLLRGESYHVLGEWLRTQAGELANKGQGTVLERYDKELSPQLIGLGWSEAEAATARKWLEEELGRLNAQMLQQSEVYLRSLEHLMQAVENRRFQTQSPARKTWRRLREVQGLGPILVRIEQWVNRILDHDPDPDTFAKADPVPRLSPETAAHYLMMRTDQQGDEEASRLRWLRAISMIIGIFLAFLLGVDAAELLNGTVPQIAETINQLKMPFLWGRELTAGMIISGFAASAGSAFWHDQLDRLQAAKRRTEQAAGLLQTARTLIRSEVDRGT